MKAILQTLCGCEREIGVTYPAPLKIEVPLFKRRRITMSITSEVFLDVFKIRRFCLQKRVRPNEIAYYLEDE